MKPAPYNLTGLKIHPNLKAVHDVLDGILGSKAFVSVTKYVTPKLVIRATRRLYKTRLLKDCNEILLTIGAPNYREREFIRQCKKVGIFPSELQYRSHPDLNVRKGHKPKYNHFRKA